MKQEQCHTEGCTRTDTEFIDVTCGPLGDYRYYCPDHMNGIIEDEERAATIRSLRYELTIAKSEVNRALERLKLATECIKDL